MAFDFDRQINRRGTASFKWDRYSDASVIPLWVADMDFASPSAVIEALHARVDHGVFGYTRTPEELVETIVRELAAEYHWQVDPSWLVWLPGLVCGLHVTCRAVGGQGDEVMTLTPIYPPFLSAPRLSEREPVKAPMAFREGRWVMDFDECAERFTDRTRLFLLCNPHNPTGRVFGVEELRRLAALCEGHGAVICSDEIHCGLVLDRDLRHVPIASLDPEIAARTITLMAPSKTFNIPGLGCSFAVISDERLRASFRRVMEGIVPHVNLLGFTAALAAYRDGGEWRAALLEYLRGNRDLVEEAVGRMPGLAMAHVEATYLAWIDCRGAGLQEPTKFFEEAGVGLTDGRSFDAPGFVRLNFACPRALLSEALDRMGRAIAKVRPRD